MAAWSGPWDESYFHGGAAGSVLWEAARPELVALRREALDLAVMRLPRTIVRTGVVLGSAVALLWTAGAVAQTANKAAATPPGLARKPAVSPVAPRDLSKPAFDVTERDFGSLKNPEVAATTVVAEVEGGVITLGDVREAMAALPPGVFNHFAFEELYGPVLEKIIKERSLVVRARREGLDADPEYKRRIRALESNELANMYLRQSLDKQVTEQVLLDRYAKDYAGKPGPLEVRGLHILTDTEDKAKDLIAKLKAGADFADLAKHNSLDAAAPNGGDTGFVAVDRVIPELRGVLSGLAVGELAPAPIRGPSGWFVVKLEGRRTQPTPAFAEVRDQLRDKVMRERVEPFAAAAEEGLTIRRYSFTGQSSRDELPGASEGSK